MFWVPPSTGKYEAIAKYLFQIFMFVCKTNVNDLFVLICVPPLCAPAVFLWIISLNSYYHAAP